MQDAQRFSKQCCEAAAALHCNGYVMRDFRLPNVLTRAGVEGDYVVVDLEYAGPTGQPWDPELLTDWDENTLTMVCALHLTPPFVSALYAQVRKVCCLAEAATLL